MLLSDAETRSSKPQKYEADKEKKTYTSADASFYSYVLLAKV